MFNPFVDPPSATLFTISGVSLYWYGMCVALGIFVAMWGWKRDLRHLKFTEHTAQHLIFWVVFSGIIGARFYHIINDIEYYWVHPWDVFAIYNGGVAIHGALFAGFLYLCWYARFHKTNIVPLSRLIASLVPWLAFGQAIGRWGNYFNQELFGNPTFLPWAIPIDSSHRLSGFESLSYFHPVFLYESIGLIVVGIIVLRMRKIYSFYEQIGAYCIGIGFLRLGMELLRIDIVPRILGARLPMLVGGGILFVGILIFWYGYNVRNKNFGG